MMAANLFQAWLSSENKLCVPDFATLEFRRCSAWRIIAPLISEGSIEVATFEVHEITELHTIKREKGISITDACAVQLCQDKSGIIVTNDPKLKNACVSIPLPCAELLWVFDHLLHKGSLPFSSALEGLNLLTARESLHKTSEVQKRLEAWTRQKSLPPTSETLRFSSSRKPKVTPPTRSYVPEI